MTTTTLSSLPGRTSYTALGVAGGIAHVSPGPQALEAARRQMEEQAEALGADAVIDVRLQVVPLTMNRPGPGTLTAALIGTAVKYV